MKQLFLFSLFCSLFTGSLKAQSDSFVLVGQTSQDAEYLIFNKDTLEISNGNFEHELNLDQARYDYIQLSHWEWPRLIYVDKGKSIDIEFTAEQIEVEGDRLNTFLLNKSKILQTYSLRWDMEESDFRKAMEEELNLNIEKIDSLFKDSDVSAFQIGELKDIEKLVVGHRTTNFVSFQERQGKIIDRNIYDFIRDLDLNNPRLQKQVNNRNFQYFYLIDKVNEDLPDSLYAFAVIDTVNKYSEIESIRKMIITSELKSCFYSDEVDHEKLISAYESNFGKLGEEDKLLQMYQQIQGLKPGNLAPSIGHLRSLEGGMYSIKDLAGQHLLISVWGSWCPHCKKELPHLKSLIEKYGHKFTSVGISFDKDQQDWKDYIEENNWDAIHLIDPDRKSTFKSNYLTSGTNLHLLIDKDGKILSDRSLKPSSKELEELIMGLE